MHKAVRHIPKLIGLAFLIWLAVGLGDWIKETLDLQIMPHSEAAAFRIILISLLAYTLLLALPFVPGAEIGITLMAVFGAGVAPLVYVATVAGLCLAYSIGSLVPAPVTCRLLRRIGANRAADLIAEADLSTLALPQSVGPAWAQTLIRHRYVAFGLLLNLPGNAVIGGGGGLSLMAGLSRSFSPLGFLLTVVIATAPVPLAVYALGLTLDHA